MEKIKKSHCFKIEATVGIDYPPENSKDRTVAVVSCIKGDEMYILCSVDDTTKIGKTMMESLEKIEGEDESKT